MPSNEPDTVRPGLIATQLREAIQRQAAVVVRESTGRVGRYVYEDLRAEEQALTAMVKCWAIARDAEDRFGLRNKVDEAYRRAVMMTIEFMDVSPNVRRILTLCHTWSKRKQIYTVDGDSYEVGRQIEAGVNYMFTWLDEQVPPLIRLAECAE